ncbi:MAG: HU family DNA-binding protein [Azoarcus sp.]|jgi:DNA-binding protein HU-beta|nr:HU family DNA-binding protein [Azoarcus sp.]
MNKTELIAEVAKLADISRTVANRAIDATLAAVTGALEKGDNVTLVGFGTFYVGERAARISKNPRTGQDIQISASHVPRFRAGKGLKDSVN